MKFTSKIKQSIS